MYFYLILVGFGWAITIVPKKVTYYASTILFLIFGIKMIRDGIKMSPSESQEEYEEVQADLRRKEEEVIKLTFYLVFCKLTSGRVEWWCNGPMIGHTRYFIGLFFCRRTSFLY